MHQSQRSSRARCTHLDLAHIALFGVCRRTVLAPALATVPCTVFATVLATVRTQFRPLVIPLHCPQINSRRPGAIHTCPFPRTFDRAIKICDHSPQSMATSGPSVTSVHRFHGVESTWASSQGAFDDEAPSRLKTKHHR